jgi:hypothetical protein
LNFFGHYFLHTLQAVALYAARMGVNEGAKPEGPGGLAWSPRSFINLRNNGSAIAVFLHFEIKRLRELDAEEAPLRAY